MLDVTGQEYKGHYIHPTADEDPNTKRWTMRVLISWEESGKMQYETIYVHLISSILCPRPSGTLRLWSEQGRYQNE
jgi:hypothetical protein